MKALNLALIFTTLVPLSGLAENTLKSTFENTTVSGFLDTYYAYDFNRPADLERQYTTQPVRHNEANINLAMISFENQGDKAHGKLSLQYGNSVVKNYAGDPVLGSTSGPDKSRMLQEAYVGYKISEKTWIDGGIYFGNIGMESWISKYNYTYSRSLMLDYVPYYSTGVRLSHEHSEKTKSQFHLMNGWQNISENNQEKALGYQFSHQFNPQFTFVYNNFLGNEKRTSNDPSKLRTYNDFIAFFNLSHQWKLNLSTDIGTHERSERSGYDIWYVGAVVVRYDFREDKGIATRIEYFNDKNQANVITSSPNGFQTWGASLNFDQKIEQLLWRTEVRTFGSKDSIYPKKSSLARTDSFLVSSLAFSF